MILYFVRHGRAEAREDWAPQDDRLRPLTEDGIARMKRSAATMKALKVRPDVILTSPLTRAYQTAEIVSDTLDVPCETVDALAHFGVGALSELIALHNGKRKLMLVGHEPDFSTVIEMITGGGHVVVKKGSLIRVDLYALRPPRGYLVWSIPPAALVLGPNDR
ncbi:MAG: phosphohistidine phosphatase SixA [Anaerolineae bacterium]